MEENKPFAKRLAALRDEAAAVEDPSSLEHVEEVAVRLAGLNFAPPVVVDAATFLRLRKEGLEKEIERLASLPEAQVCILGGVDQRLSCDDQRLQHITVLLFYFKKLLLLRAGDPGEWDEIDELYVHD